MEYVTSYHQVHHIKQPGLPDIKFIEIQVEESNYQMTIELTLGKNYTEVWLLRKWPKFIFFNFRLSRV